METSIKLVTPAIASTWLRRLYQGQRTIRRSNVDELVQHMQAGSFVDNGDPIRFDVNSRLIDGQHRLHAILESGTSQRLLVVEGLPTTAYATIDQGAKRTPADLLRFIGVDDFGVKATICSKYMRCFWNPKGAQHVAEFAEKNAGHLDTVVLVLEDFRSSKWAVTKSSIGAAALHLLRSGCDPSDVTSFFMQVSSGSGLSSEHPIMVLRDALLTGHCVPGFWHTVGSRAKQVNVIAVTVHLWNKWLDGAHVRRVRVPRKGKALHIAEPRKAVSQ